MVEDGVSKRGMRRIYGKSEKDGTHGDSPMYIIQCILRLTILLIENVRLPTAAGVAQDQSSFNITTICDYICDE